MAACLVTSLADSGSGTLRDCIDQINSTAGGTIDFAVTGAIRIQSDLSPVFVPVTITGPGSESSIPLVSIQRDNTGFADFGLRVLGGNSTVSNLAVGGFGGFGRAGLVLDTNGSDTVEHCYLGFGFDAMEQFGPLPNNEGMLVGTGAPNSTIGGTTVDHRGNVIANNVDKGLEIQSTHNLVVGNFIGTDDQDTSGEGNGSGLVVEGDANTIGGVIPAARNLISGNQGAGAQLIGASNNLIQGNYIGTKQSGNLALPNGGVGIAIQSQSNGNLLGGTTLAERNVISGNNQGGVLVSISDNNRIEGDVIGLNPTGTVALPNSKFGVSVSAGTSNTIGGTVAADRNYIAGNNGDGVQVSGTTNLMDQDYIGTDFTGTSAFANAGAGVVVSGGQGNRIGGTLTDPRVPHNLISANRQSGIQIFGQASDTMVQGNFIGTDVTGTQPLGNATDPSVGLLLNAGISISGGATYTCVGATFVGGTVNACLGGRNLNGTQISEYRNVIAANQGPDGLAPGVSVTGFDTDPFATTSNNLIAGNFIGTDWSGTLTSYQPDPLTPPALLGNGRGVYVWGRATNNVVGDPTPRGATLTFGTRNIIAGNLYDGVAISDRGTSNNRLYDNYIGTDLGGTLLQDANGVRYGNGAGVDIFSAATGNQVGGYIRPDLMHVSNPNELDIHGNLIVGNQREGVRISDINTSQNLVQGNLIGIFLDPRDNIDKPLGNYIGVALAGASSNNLIGGTVLDTVNMQDYIIAAGNTISGNNAYGVAFHDSRTYANRVEGNMIGPDKTGLKAIVNRVDANTDVTVQPYGVAFYNGAGNAVANPPTGNTLGGTTVLSRNIITGNLYDGVIIFGTPDPFDREALPAYNVVLGNYIGTNVNGTDYLKDPYKPADDPLVNVGNGGNGINVYFSAHDNTIGGTAPGLHNLITGNPLDGILIDSEAYNNRVQGNWIGLDARGSLFRNNPGGGNGGNGIEINLGHNDTLPPHDNTIGGGNDISTGASHAGNVISANTLDGILIAGGSINNVIQGNYIGTDTSGNVTNTGRADLGNGTVADANGIYYNGIHILGDGTNQNTVGGLFDSTMPNLSTGNSIGFNGGDGILIDTGILNPIWNNNIARNNDPNAVDGSGVDSGINLVNNGNDMVMHPDPSWITSVNYDTTSGLLSITGSVPAGILTPDTTYILQFFLNSYQPPSGLGEGEYIPWGALSIFLVTDDTGAAVIDPNDPVNPAQFYLPNLAMNVGNYQWVTMTLTYPNPNMDPAHPWGDTSDFSENSPTNNVPLTVTASPGTDGSDGTATVPSGVRSLGVALVPLRGWTARTVRIDPAAAPVEHLTGETPNTAADRFFAGLTHRGHRRERPFDDFPDLFDGF